MSYQSVDILRFVDEHTNLFRVSIEDCLDEWRLGNGEEKHGKKVYIAYFLGNVDQVYYLVLSDKSSYTEDQ